jgi:D-sedoheptulose 7-phosphate isomerase
MDKEKDSAFIDSYLEESTKVKLALVQQKDLILEIATALYEIAKKGGRIYTCGNGGSACDAIHFAEELVAQYYRERPGIRAQHLLDPGALTCWANDYNFDTVFERQIETLATKDDAVVGITTSGNSKNVLAAIRAANKVGALSIAFSGGNGGRIKLISNYTFIAASDRTPYIQEAHITVIHIICDLLEQWLFPENVTPIAFTREQHSLHLQK